MITAQSQHSSLILIADDDRFTRTLLRQVLEREGYRVEESEDGESCLAAYTRYKPDMVLLDAMMPVMDGFTCCSKLRSLAGEEPTPILTITGLNDSASVDWAFEAGATDYITKPIHTPVLLQRVRRLLEARAAEKALREREQQYRSVVDSVQEAIFQTNAAGEWSFLNPAWTALTGYAIAESLGTPCLDYVYPQDRPLHQELWHSLLQGNCNACQHEVRYSTKDGQCRWMAIHASPIFDADGSAIGLSGTLQDITKRIHAEALEKEKVRLETEIIERQRTEETIRKALVKEKELGELRSRIITTISHEFRTPLTAILGSTDLLEKYGERFSQEKTEKHLHRIGDSVTHMTKLLDDVVLIGQAEVGQLQFNPAPVDLERVCREVVEEWQLNVEEQWQGKGAPPTLALWVQGEQGLAYLDKILLRRLLTNLLSNAVKFSPEGGAISVDLVCEPGGATLRVQDEGIGIPADEQERLFESFYRASNAELIPGVGLGLAIAKKCVELHQGQITIESEPGNGTTFTVTLPLTPVVGE
jgi:PAS domain S-box-containing protein